MSRVQSLQKGNQQSKEQSQGKSPYIPAYISNEIVPPTAAESNPLVAVGGDIEGNIGFYFFYLMLTI